MTVIWLIVWLIQGTPEVSMWNAWAVALAVTLALDFMGAVKSRS